jgi:hypothetical protein
MTSSQIAALPQASAVSAFSVSSTGDIAAPAADEVQTESDPQSDVAAIISSYLEI